MAVYLRELNDDVIRLNQNLKINNFIPEGILDLIELNVPENNYVLGVKYETGECQICMSGHPKTGENITQGCLREMTEEMFLSSKDGNIKYCNKKAMNHFFAISMRETFISRISNYNRDKDLPDRAVICVHGNEFEILRYMSRLSMQTKNKDQINGIWAAKKNKVTDCIRRMQRTKRRSRIY